MNLINLSLPGKKTDVPIYIGKGMFDKIHSLVHLEDYSSILVIVDENVAYYWSDLLHKIPGDDTPILIVSADERNKSLATVEKIWMFLSEKKFDRKSLILNIGGGMVCDIGAFAASTYMRGIDFIQVPTTLLAQADAAIGGKTGFNFNGLKNIIGTFSAPKAIISDTSFLSSLPARELNSGFAEIIKHAIIADEELFNGLQKKIPHSQKEIDNILSISTQLKCSIVKRDPYEKKERKKLNFGHTVGHAIEMVCQNSSNPLLHGEAIAIGMISEAKMSVLSGSLSETKFKKLEALIGKVGLPATVDSKYKNAILRKMLSDKKNVKQQIKWVFLKDIGNVKVDMQLTADIIDKGLNYILK